MGHINGDTDPDQLVFEMYGLILALHHDARFLKLPGSVNRAEAGFERLMKSYQPQQAEAGKAAGKQSPKPAVKKTANSV
jgi:hypothetical protein